MKVIFCWKPLITTEVVLKTQKSLTRGKKRKEKKEKGGTRRDTGEGEIN